MPHLGVSDVRSANPSRPAMAESDKPSASSSSTSRSLADRADSGSPALAGVTSAELPSATLVLHRVEEVADQQHPVLEQAAEPPVATSTTCRVSTCCDSIRIAP